MIYLDPDYRKEPKSNNYCCRCQKPLEVGAGHIIWIDDWQVYTPQEDKPEIAYTALIGPSCAKKIGLSKDYLVD